jgi:hypothetical protein
MDTTAHRVKVLIYVVEMGAYAIDLRSRAETKPRSVVITPNKTQYTTLHDTGPALKTL